MQDPFGGGGSMVVWLSIPCFALLVVEIVCVFNVLCYLSFFFFSTLVTQALTQYPAMVVCECSNNSQPNNRTLTWSSRLCVDNTHQKKAFPVTLLFDNQFNDSIIRLRIE
jgi:hypothetical protein